ncbi:GNAT family N-acetyltransferase [Formosa sediminum]|uniref:GNAT family N-acetyltransferase n=1 Tax=Formosa sediminum TaxID=2594004 RepID=A0A516GT52_9FLAO|nr:GNAT family N-acetyltransferase [Formosa sediminum]QDO94701.1 GNAT family N-acetyltransferase [Formosa sediminum]
MKLIVSEINNEADFNTYLNVINTFEYINPFYKIWAANLEDVLEEKLRYFKAVSSEDDTQLLVVMPFLILDIEQNGVSTSYFDVKSPYGYSGPIFNEDLPDADLMMFWKLVDQWYLEHNVVTEFIRFSLNNNCKLYSGTLISALTNVKGEIISEEAQWNNFKSKVRNNYRKSTSEQLKVKFVQGDCDAETIALFHSIYIQTMARIHASKDYLYSLNYFKKIIEISKEEFLIVFVYAGDIAISVELILIAGDTLFSYLGGTLSEFFNLRPNDFLKINVINWARAHEYKYYVLGGGRTDGDNLYLYKKTFFPKDEDVIYYTGRKIINEKVYNKLSAMYFDTDVEHENYFPIYRKPIAI